MSLGEAPKSAEAQKTFERAEYYFDNIRKRILRFTKEADSVTLHDEMTKKTVDLPTYFFAHMVEYDRLKIEEAELKIKAESSPEVEQVGFYLKPSSYPSMLDSIRNTRFLVARNVLDAVDGALVRPTPLIEEGEGFFSKLEKCDGELDRLRKENIELKEHVTDITKKLENCQKNYEGLRNRVSWNEPKKKGDKEKGELGDVTA